MNNLVKNIRWAIGSASLGAILLFGITSVSVSVADEDESNEHEQHEKYERGEHERAEQAERHSTKWKQDKVYAAECSECHLAYPANLLPAESWKKIMANLDDHFGENAELDKSTTLHIANYLQSQALPIGKRSKWSRMLRNLKDKAPTRITKLPFFIHKHDELSDDMVKNNPKVGSFSHCNACHKDAEKSMFDEDTVSIPNFGRWED